MPAGIEASGSSPDVGKITGQMDELGGDPSNSRQGDYYLVRQ